MTTRHIENESEEPGKSRTWWHSLLYQLLRFVLDGYCDVREELLVGKMPLRIDVLLIRLRRHDPTARAKRKLHKLLRLLNAFTFVEFKSPVDSVEPGDLLRFVACVLLWIDQQTKRPMRWQISLVMLVPSLNKAFREDARYLRCRIVERGNGLHQLTGLPLKLWLVETDVADADDPVLVLMGRELLDHTHEVIQSLSQHGHGELLNYTIQQIHQFDQSEDFAMRHRNTREMHKISKSLLETVLELTPPEERLRGVPAEDRLRGLSPEEIIQVLGEKGVRELVEKLPSTPTGTRKRK